ncbi:hypothetical protein C1S82_25890 [Mycolicibacterium cosmeticum]|uniref:DNA-binding protein n=1 Tax=Mycolicibacterium cosmeticum TaxID=258533 RepID=W9AIF0_MYCCO|nr:hypothetical protein [Mycolicibacterium cosmeticum]TLH68888.1 hypothetical protein C1S82_25890 [Mycolicibacterium cosmeticum]CDO05499.1 hypothetical protein BN977_00273 [Mycolicibacterium cosmeticum]
MTAPTEQLYDLAEVVKLAHERDLRPITENSVITAGYSGAKPQKRTKIDERIYYAHGGVEAWLAGYKLN